MTEHADASTVLAGHQGRLDRLARLETEISRLRADEVDLEVTAITAETVLESLDVRDVGVDRRVAAQLVGLRQRQASLSEALERVDDRKEPPTQRWSEGNRHLFNWLDESESSGRGPERIRFVMGLLSVAALVAAFTLHLAFLILLLPIGATSAFMWNGDDVRWRRIASQRAFEGIGLKAPRTWTPADVRIRLDELEDEIEKHAKLRERREGGIDTRSMGDEEIAQELAENALEVQSLAANHKFDWDSMSVYNQHAMTCMSAAHSAQVELEVTRSKRAALGDEAESLRSAIYLYLKRERATESIGKADTDTLRQGLEKQAARIA